jgi:MFS family permease
MARSGLHVGATGFGFMTASMGVGAVLGGLLVATRGRTGLRPLVMAASVFGVAVALAAVAPSLPLELAALGFAGAASITFMATGNSTLQLSAQPSMRGRVMSLWFVAFQGSTPVGGPVVGWVMDALGPRAGLGVGAMTCLTVAVLGAGALRRRRPQPGRGELATGPAA